MGDNNLPLLIHSGKDDMTSAVNTYELAKKIPNVRICAAHIGRFNRKFFDMMLRDPLPNLYVDLCPFLGLYSDYLKRKETDEKVFKIDRNEPVHVLKYLYEILPNNLIWGTDTPYNYTANLSSQKDKQPTSYQDEVALLKMIDPPVIKKVASQNTINFIFGQRDRTRT